jgi:WD40 repeat protein
MMVTIDSSNMLSSNYDEKPIKLWDKNTGELLRTLGYSSHSANSVAFDTHDILASGHDDFVIRLWNKNNGHLLKTLTGHGYPVMSVAFDTKLLNACQWFYG